MPGPNYTLIPGDNVHLEQIINDLSSRILTSPIDTSTIVSAISNLSTLISAVDISAVSNMASANSDAISVLSNAVLTGDYVAEYKSLVLEK